MNLHPIFLSDEQYKNYYEGYSNSTLWPLCHYFFAYTLYRKSFWQSYQEVNALFCREIIRLVEPDDWVWVQDYQLMLLPEMLRQELPGCISAISITFRFHLMSYSEFCLNVPKY